MSAPHWRRWCACPPTSRCRPSSTRSAGPSPAREAILLANGILRPSPEGETIWIEPTPELFSGSCQPNEHDLAAPERRAWLRFLGEVLPGDPQAVGLLGEWFGYCLVQDISQQKILAVIGPPRSGKGTIERVLGGLLGPGGAGTSLAALGERFGLQGLIGKNLATVGDARPSGRSDQQ